MSVGHIYIYFILFGTFIINYCGNVPDEIFALKTIILLLPNIFTCDVLHLVPFCPQNELSNCIFFVHM